MFFKRRARDPAQAEALARVEGWFREALGREDVELIVRQIVCPDPGCTDIQTVALLTVPGAATRPVKLEGRAADVTRAAVWAACVPDRAVLPSAAHGAAREKAAQEHDPERHKK